MTVGKASALAAGFVGAFALGVAIGPTVHDKLSNTSTRDTVVTESRQQRQFNNYMVNASDRPR